MPTASETVAMEAPEATTHMAEASDMGDTYAVRETGSAKMGCTEAAIHTCGAAHAMAEAMIEAAVVGVSAIKHGGVAVVAVIIGA
jgi:hypothetical protein